MKNLICASLIILLVICSSCKNGNKKKESNSFKNLTEKTDTSAEVEDSIKEDSTEISVKPTKIDRSFDDFLYSFANNKRMQMLRIEFPLTFVNNNKVTKIQKEFWKFDRLFYKRPYYTMLFDRESELQGQHSGLRQAQFEWIYLRTGKIQEYNFKRKKTGAWTLQSINLHNITSSDDENFFKFFYKFANDSAFQHSRTHEPITYVTNDPDDDFAILTTTMDINQWVAWKIFLPKETLSNINYGQTNRNDSATKILCVKGQNAGNGYTLFFRRIGHTWQFYKYEDISN